MQDEKDAALLLGRVNVKLLQSSPRFNWFEVGYNDYSTNASAIEQLSKNSAAISFIVFGGTWNNQTQLLLPQFYKVLDEAKINRGRAMLYFLDRDKHSPQGFEGEYSINDVPTFIVLKNGQEIGRIAGNVSSSIDGDLADIVTR